MGPAVLPSAARCIRRTAIQTSDFRRGRYDGALHDASLTVAALVSETSSLQMRPAQIRWSLAGGLLHGHTLLKHAQCKALPGITMRLATLFASAAAISLMRQPVTLPQTADTHDGPPPVGQDSMPSPPEMVTQQVNRIGTKLQTLAGVRLLIPLDGDTFNCRADVDGEEVVSLVNGRVQLLNCTLADGREESILATELFAGPPVATFYLFDPVHSALDINTTCWNGEQNIFAPNLLTGRSDFNVTFTCVKPQEWPPRLPPTPTGMEGALPTAEEEPVVKVLDIVGAAISAALLVVVTGAVCVWKGWLKCPPWQREPNENQIELLFVGGDADLADDNMRPVPFPPMVMVHLQVPNRALPFNLAERVDVLQPDARAGA
ncbi:MAG: hypothetical protein H7332_15550 [Bdellovibrionales bacterium]|nr:hypothetical protein [Ramlibacter sp.]